MSETRDDLREALARAIFERGRKQGGIDPETWEVAGDEMQAWLLGHADAMITGPFAPILAQVSALQAEVERLQKVEGEREKGRVPDGTGLSPKGEAPDGSSSQGDFDPSRRTAAGLRVDVAVWAAAKRLSDAQKHQPEWIWSNRAGDASFGRWAKQPLLAPYVRADLALAMAAQAIEAQGAETIGLGAEHESAVANGDAPSDNPLTKTKEGSEHV